MLEFWYLKRTCYLSATHNLHHFERCICGVDFSSIFLFISCSAYTWQSNLRGFSYKCVGKNTGSLHNNFCNYLLRIRRNLSFGPLEQYPWIYLFIHLSTYIYISENWGFCLVSGRGQLSSWWFGSFPCGYVNFVRTTPLHLSIVIIIITLPTLQKPASQPSLWFQIVWI